MTHRVPVLEIGGTHVSAALVDTQDWSVHHRVRHDVDAHGSAAEIIAAYAGAAAELDAPAGARWGVAMPDPFDYATGVARFRDVGKYDALYGVDVGRALTDAVGDTTGHRPSGFVFINDADAFVLGEWVHGVASGARRCVGITLGTGLGTGWIVDGHVTTSEPGVPELGRARTITLDGAGLEEIVSTRGIKRRFASLGGSPQLDVARIAQLAGAGDTVAETALAGVFTDLGRGLRPSLRAFAPDVIVMGGSMARSWALFEPHVERGLDWAAHPPIRVASSLEDAGLRGAAYIAARGVGR